ncbi:hypothetical protein EON63_12795 [archaeon]|nr:MAG: hypothetical protein EON63_12795 [archaeon]
MPSSDSEQEEDITSICATSIQPHDCEDLSSYDTAQEREEMPRWLRYLPNYEAVVNHKPAVLTYTRTHAHTSTSSNSTTALSTSTYFGIVSSGVPMDDAQPATRVNGSGDTCSGGDGHGYGMGMGIGHHASRHAPKRLHRSIDGPLEEEVEGVDRVPTLWPEEDIPGMYVYVCVGIVE